MKKLFAIVLSLILSCITLFGTSAVVYAEELSTEEMRAILINKFVPEYYLDYLSDEEMQTLYMELKDKSTGYGGTVTTSLSEGGQSESGIQPMGNIPTDDMMLKITKTNVYTNASTEEINYINFYIQYYWYDLPNYRKTDGITVNWDSSCFTYKSNSFSSSCYVGANNGNEHFTNTFKLDYPNVIEQGGIGYDIFLKDYAYLDDVEYRSNELSGVSTFSLYPKTNPMYDRTSSSYTYTSSINIQYRHNRNPFVGSVGFTVSGFSITFDLSTFTDTTARSVNIFYSH